MAPERHVDGEQQRADGGAQQRKGIPREVLDQTAGDADKERLDIQVKNCVHRMHPEVGEWRQHGSRMVDLVEFPQKRNLMLQEMVDPVGQLERQVQAEDDEALEVDRQILRRLMWP